MNRLFAAAGLAGMLVLSGCGDNGDPQPPGTITNSDVDRMMQNQQASPAATATPQGSAPSGAPPGTSAADPFAGQPGAGGTAAGSSLPPR